MGLPAAIIGSAALGAGASAVGASKQASASRRAGRLGAAAGAQAREDLSPFRDAGVNALGAQMELLGLPVGGAGGGGFQPMPTGQGDMSFLPVGGFNSLVPGGAVGGGNNALAALAASPGFQFRLQQGLGAIENSAAARGGLFSGNTGRALTEFGQNFASNEFANRLNQLALLAGRGQSAAAGQGAFGIEGANAMGQGMIGSANAFGGGLEGIANAANAGIGNAILLNFLRNQPTGAVT